MNDTNEANESKAAMGTIELLNGAMKQYGPSLLGVVILMIVWFGIMDPTIERMRIDWDKHQKIISELQDVVTDMKITADTTHDTALIVRELQGYRDERTDSR